MSTVIAAIGLDLSLTATGLAEVYGDSWVARTLKPPRAVATGHERLAWILSEIQASLGCDQTKRLVVVEGPSYGAKGSAVHQIAGLWWLVTHKLWTLGVQVAIAPPSALKKYATGKGNANKDAMMLATARRFPQFEGDNNAADALWLAAAGADQLGRPPVVVPAVQREALAKFDWPVTS